MELMARIWFFLVNLRDKIYSVLEFRDVDEFEKSIRWKRDANKILEDKFVYKGKACTDLSVLFLACCKAKGFEARFVKVFKEKMVHSVCEVKINNNWYWFDVSFSKSKPVKGLFNNKEWKVWKRGKDAWSLGLKEFNDI